MNAKTIGQFLAALRKSQGMTQQDVAERLNVTNKTVNTDPLPDHYFSQ